MKKRFSLISLWERLWRPRLGRRSIDQSASTPQASSYVRITVAVLPAVLMVTAAVYLRLAAYDHVRSDYMAEQARLVASAVDMRLERLLNLTRFCASAPAITARMDPESFLENCARSAEMLNAWVVVVALGENHQQLINSRSDAPQPLPTYPREMEHATLLEVEALSRATGQPAIADVFTGRIYKGEVLAAGQWLRLADGREAMLYISVAAEDFSKQLAGMAGDGQTVFGLVDRSQRTVARSKDIDKFMFLPAAPWLREAFASNTAGAKLAVRAPPEIGGLWDAGYRPLSAARGWMAIAVQPVEARVHLWNAFSLESALALIGLVFSAFLLRANLYRERALRRIVASDRAKREAEAQNKDKSRLLASFAHDIRSPLVTMIGNLMLMEEGKTVRPTDLRSARTSAEALLQLVDDILELSFLGSGEFALHGSPTDLRRLAQDLCAQVRFEANRKGLELTLDLDESVPHAVVVDRLRLQQLLSNLLSNGIKYTEKGSVTLKILADRKDADTAELTFSVADTGVGLSQADLPIVFREFGRLDRPVERREGGTGLGLAICTRILKAMGSELRVESAVGKGSTFSFRLHTPVARTEALCLEAKPLSGMTILYAEDEPVIRAITSKQLTLAGAEVIEAGDGAEALAKLQTATPDLLLLDIQMPGLDGVETLRRLQDIAPSRAYPVFVLTSHISGPKAAKARSVGADEVFTKPVQILPLAAALLAKRGDHGVHTPNMGGNQTQVEETKSRREYRSLLVASPSPVMFQYLPEFERRMQTDLTALEQMVSEGKIKEAQSLAHRCLGVCQVFGAKGLASRLNAIEEAAEASDSVKLRRLARNLQDMLDQTVEQMKQRAKEKR